MKNDKKLKLGLADVSNLFSHDGKVLEYPPLSVPKRKAFTIEPPEQAIDDLPPRLLTVSFISCSSHFNSQNQIKLVKKLAPEFQATYFFSSKSDALIREQAIHFIYPDNDYFEDLLQPAKMPSLVSEKKRALVVFDSRLSKRSLGSTFSYYDLLDHCIFVIDASTDHLAETFEQIKLGLAKNQALRCSLLLVGSGSSSLGSFVYEKFNEIVCELLGYNLGFMGWMDGTNICLNLDLLNEEGQDPMLQSSKMCLSELIYRPAFSA